MIQQKMAAKSQKMVEVRQYTGTPDTAATFSDVTTTINACDNAPQVLERWLFLNPEHAQSGQLPTKAEKATLSDNCGVEVRKLEYWFWNRNQQVKRDFARKYGPSGSQQPASKTAAAAGSGRTAAGKTPSIKAAPPEAPDAGNAGTTGKRESSPEGNRDSRSRPLIRLRPMVSRRLIGRPRGWALGALKRQRVDDLAVETAERFRASGGSAVAKVHSATLAIAPQSEVIRAILLEDSPWSLATRHCECICTVCPLSWADVRSRRSYCRLERSFHSAAARLVRTLPQNPSNIPSPPPFVRSFDPVRVAPHATALHGRKSALLLCGRSGPPDAGGSFGGRHAQDHAGHVRIHPPALRPDTSTQTVSHQNKCTHCPGQLNPRAPPTFQCITIAPVVEPTEFGQLLQVQTGHFRQCPHTAMPTHRQRYTAPACGAPAGSEADGLSALH